MNTKIYSANPLGNKEKPLFVIESGKVYSANAFGNKDKTLFVIEGGYNLTELIAALSRSGKF